MTPEELDVLQQQYNKEREAGHLTVQARFNLAWYVPLLSLCMTLVLQSPMNRGLVKCSGPQSKDDISRGVALLMAIYRDEASRRRECLYYLALGHYQLANYEEARKFNGLFSHTDTVFAHLCHTDLLVWCRYADG